MKFAAKLSIAVMAVTVNLLVGCAQKGNDQGTAPTATPGAGPGVTTSPNSSSPNGTPGSKPSLGLDGTSTSGGGTGVDRKAYESYIVDPTQLPPVKEYILPLLANIQRDAGSDRHGYEVFFQVKKWYIAPVKLKKISKGLLGVSFIKSETQQIARQTLSEVWIDKHIYDAMAPAPRDQAELLLHEMVMSMYLMKFLTMPEMCRINMLVYGGEDPDSQSCVKSSDLLAKAMPPESPHPLNEQDNVNIRYVTDWIMKNAQFKITETSFLTILFNNGFDKRIFNPFFHQRKDANGNLKISGKELIQAIKGAELSGNMPTECTTYSSSVSESCTVTIDASSESINTLEIAGYNLHVTVNHQPPVDVFIYTGDEVTLNTSVDLDGKLSYVYPFGDWQSHIKVGDRVHSGFFLFHKSEASQTPLALDSILLKPGVVVSIDKSRTPVCLLEQPKVVNFIDDGIRISQVTSKPTSVQMMYLATPPFAFCSSDNVVDKP